MTRIRSFVLAWALASALILGALALVIGVDSALWAIP